MADNIAASQKNRSSWSSEVIFSDRESFFAWGKVCKIEQTRFFSELRILDH